MNATDGRVGARIARAVVVAALLSACVTTRDDHSTATATGGGTEAASSSHSAGPAPSGAVSCANVFDATAGRVAMTVGAFGGSYGIATVNADGTDFREVVPPGPARDQPHNGTEAPRWTPDGGIVFDSNRAGGPDDWHVFKVDGAGDPVQLTGGDDGIENHPVLSTDGTTLVYAKYLATPEGPAPFGGGGIFSSDADGSHERQVTTVPDGVTPEFPEGAIDEWPDLSPDGERIVFVRGHTPTEGGLYVVNIDGTGLRRLIEGDFQPLRPRWSPDGEWIVVQSNGDRFLSESANVWIVRPDGTELQQLTHESAPAQAWAPDWSPDGTHIVYVHTRGGVTALDVITPDGIPTCTLWDGTGASTGWDPDWGPPEP